ncbi:hypothetical protein ACFYOK_35415 [Microbispora bryophytorum]
MTSSTADPMAGASRSEAKKRTAIGTGLRSTKIAVPSPDRRRDPTAWRML